MFPLHLEKHLPLSTCWGVCLDISWETILIKSVWWTWSNWLFLVIFCCLSAPIKVTTPSYRLFRSSSLPCLSCCPPSLITTDPAYTETRKARYQEALIHVCCLFLPLTSWIALNSRCLRGRTLRRVWAFLSYGWAITFTHLPSQCSYLANVDKQDGLDLPWKVLTSPLWGHMGPGGRHE